MSNYVISKQKNERHLTLFKKLSHVRDTFVILEGVSKIYFKASEFSQTWCNISIYDDLKPAIYLYNSKALTKIVLLS